ncbi:MAG: hypothetical protein Q7T25_02565 [Sideroxyarcus sp.]|nr:hypothetical protein [Sideroxyarcus sp.]
MKKFLFLALCTVSMAAMADTCLHAGKKGTDGSSTYYEYGNCAPKGTTADR